jgi:hypothetical protein
MQQRLRLRSTHQGDCGSIVTPWLQAACQTLAHGNITKNPYESIESHVRGRCLARRPRAGVATVVRARVAAPNVDGETRHLHSVTCEGGGHWAE